MATLDWIVLGIFFLGLIGIIIWVLYQKDKDTTDYFLAGKNAGWLSIGSSIFASNIGSEHLVGLAGAGFISGMAMAHWEMHARVPGKTFFSGFQEHTFRNFTGELCAYQSCSNSVCRRGGF
jgi:uncharacterized sodium:solute symporter family permease YidK